MEYFDLLKVILASMASGAGIGILAYLSKRQKGEKFDGWKLGKTGFIGGAVGVIMHFTDNKITADNYQVYITANAGVIYMLDKLWSLIRNSVQKKMLTGAILFVMLASGCASMGGKIATPETPEEKLAYAEATLTGLTIAAVQLNNAQLITLEKAKEIESIITKVELALRLGRVALNGKDAKTAEDQLIAIQRFLLELNAFVESKRVDYISRPLPPTLIEGEPKPIEEEPS